MGLSLRDFFFILRIFFLAVYVVFSFQLVLSSHQFSPRYFASYVISLWARVSANDPRDIMRNNILFSLCRLLSRGTHAGDTRVYEEPSSSKQSSNAIFITSS